MPAGTIGGSPMRQVQVRKGRRAAGARWRRELERVDPLDPRDPDVVRAKALQRRPPGAGATR
jgi:hypothetical protein